MCGVLTYHHWSKDEQGPYVLCEEHTPTLHELYPELFPPEDEVPKYTEEELKAAIQDVILHLAGKAKAKSDDPQNSVPAGEPRAV